MNKSREIVSVTKSGDSLHSLYMMVLKDVKTGNLYRADWEEDKLKIEFLKDRLEAQGADWNDLEELESLSWSRGSNDYEMYHED